MKIMNKRILEIIILYLFIQSFAGCSSKEADKQRFLIKGNEQLRKQEYREAIRYFNEALKIDPGYADALLNRGVAKYETGDAIGALGDYNAALEAKSNYLEALFNRANAYRELKQFKLALQDIEEVKLTFPDSAVVHFAEGLVLSDSKDYEQSLVAFTKAIALDGNNPEAWVNRGTVHYYLDNYEKAEADLNKALALNPEESNAYNALALLYLEQDRMDEALSKIDEALSLEPGQAYYLNNKGEIMLAMDSIAAAEALVNQSLLADPRNGWAYRNKGLIYLAQDLPEDALRVLKQAEKMDPTIDRIYEILGRAYLANGENQKACDIWSSSKSTMEIEALRAEFCN